MMLDVFFLTHLTPSCLKLKINHIFLCKLHLFIFPCSFCLSLQFESVHLLFLLAPSSRRRLRCCPPALSDGSLSLAGPASLSGGSTLGLPLPETGPPGQPPSPLALGRPFPFLLPQVERGLEEEVHLPAARTPEDHHDGG